MKLADAVVLGCREALPGAWLLRLATPAIAASARPGQLVLLRAHTGPTPVLRAGLPIHRIARGEISFLFRDETDATHSLARCRPGETVAAQGPLGAGFAPAAAARNLLLLAEGPGVAPLVAIADAAVAAGLSVTLLAGADTASSLLPAALLPAEVEYRTATSDGSQGAQGGVLGLLNTPGAVPLLLWADQVVAAGGETLYRRLREAIAAVRTGREPGFAHAVVSGPLGCGLAACLGCALETRRGLVYLCKHGPVLDLDDLLL